MQAIGNRWSYIEPIYKATNHLKKPNHVYLPKRKPVQTFQEGLSNEIIQHGNQPGRYCNLYI